MANQLSRTMNTATKKYIKGETSKLFQERKLFALMKKKGRISYSNGGLSVVWEMEFKRAVPFTSDGETPSTYDRKDRWLPAEIGWAGLKVTDAMSKADRLANQDGPTQIIDVYKNQLPKLVRDITHSLPGEFYNNGNAAGMSKRVAGIETLFGGTHTVKIDDGTDRGSANAADIVLFPNGTYAGVATNLQQYGGFWNSQTNMASTWPNGHGDDSATYDFNSPIVVNYTSSAWGGSTATWADQCVSATRFMILAGQRYGTMDDAMDVTFLDRELYRQYLENNDTKERVIASGGELVKLGFKNVFEQDGCEVTWETGMPSATGYGLNVSHMELMSRQKVLFDADGPNWNQVKGAWLTDVDFHGQLKFDAARFFGKLKNLA